jgi:plastocyanin
MHWKLLILGLVVITSGCMDNGQSGQTSAPTEETTDNTENYTVYLTESGFQPSELTIQQGETVTWVNNASNSMWVASDQHPSHNNYAGSALYQHCQGGDQTEAAFDQCSSGGEFSFTFEKTGEWSYHNHERAVQGGTITVE